MPKYAAIDCGTNSTRLLIKDGHTDVVRDLVVTRLGEGVDATGRLSEAAIARTVAAITEFKALLDQHDVHNISIFATSAARDSENCLEFFNAVDEVLGMKPALLSGEEEGFVTFAGAVSALPTGNYMVCDIGGGSTELIVEADTGIAAFSMDIGSVRVTERFLTGDPYDADSVETAREFIRQWLSDANDALPKVAQDTTLLGVAGTITNLAGMDLGVTGYEPGVTHGHDLSLDHLQAIVDRLLSQTQSERLDDPTIEPARADIIVGGALILLETMRFHGFDNCLVSETDNLDGAIAQHQQRDQG